MIIVKTKESSNSSTTTLGVSSKFSSLQ